MSSKPKHPYRGQKRGVCTAAGCTKPHYASGVCRNHYGLNRRWGTPVYRKDIFIKCAVLDCEDKAGCKGLCPFHTSRKRQGKSLSRPKGNSGALNHMWKGGVAMYPNHHELKKIRLIVLKEENYTCRYCGKPTKQVHHIDHSKDNHKRENIAACCHSCNLRFSGKKTTSKYIRIYGMTMAALAKTLNVSTATVSRMHKGMAV